MVRAKMSDSSERRTREIDADQLGFASAYQWNLMAELEARVILSETEPEVLGMPWLTYKGFTLSEVLDCSAPCEALAEALAAFIAEGH
jgi:hypothetical protein